MTRPPDIEATTAFRIRNALLTITRCWDVMLPDAPKATIAGTIGRHATGSRPPVPAHVLDARSQALSRLAGWTLVVLDDRDLHASVNGHDAHAMGKFLKAHADWLADHEAAEDVLSELEDSARRCQSIAEPFAALRFAGVCDVCTGDLMGDGRTARCKECKAVTDWETQQSKIRDAVKDRLLTAQEIVTLSPQLGHRLAPVVVNRWAARGTLIAKGHDHRGRALYSAGDVCEQIDLRYGAREGAA